MQLKQKTWDKIGGIANFGIAILCILFLAYQIVTHFCNKPNDVVKEQLELKAPQTNGTKDKQPSAVRAHSVDYHTTQLPQNDLMLNIVANPTFSLEDFVASGINKDNVSLGDIQIYRDDPYIRNVFTDEFGNLNEMRLQSLYHKATEWMKRLKNDKLQYDMESSFQRDNTPSITEKQRVTEETSINSQPCAQINNQRRTILQVTDVSTDRIVPSNTFERTKAQTLGLLVRIDLFDNSIKLQFMDDNGNLIEEPMILDYQQYNYTYYNKYVHNGLDGSTIVYEYTLIPTFNHGKLVKAMFQVDINGLEDARLTLRSYNAPHN